MYNLSNRFKIFSLSLIILGSLGWFYSYSTSHLTIEEVKQALSDVNLTYDFKETTKQSTKGRGRPKKIQIEESDSEDKEEIDVTNINIYKPRIFPIFISSSRSKSPFKSKSP